MFIRNTRIHVHYKYVFFFKIRYKKRTMPRGKAGTSAAGNENNIGLQKFNVKII